MCGVAAGACRSAIASHFAGEHGNVGEVQAKEGAQETAVTLAGLVTGLWAATALNANEEAKWTAFTVLTIIHVLANYYAVRILALRRINQTRATLLAKHWINSATYAQRAIDSSSKAWNAPSPALLCQYEGVLPMQYSASMIKTLPRPCRPAQRKHVSPTFLRNEPNGWVPWLFASPCSMPLHDIRLGSSFASVSAAARRRCACHSQPATAPNEGRSSRRSSSSSSSSRSNSSSSSVGGEMSDRIIALHLSALGAKQDGSSLSSRQRQHAAVSDGREASDASNTGMHWPRISTLSASRIGEGDAAALISISGCALCSSVPMQLTIALTDACTPVHTLLSYVLAVAALDLCEMMHNTRAPSHTQFLAAATQALERMQSGAGAREETQDGSGQGSVSSNAFLASCAVAGWEVLRHDIEDAGYRVTLQQPEK